MRVYQEIGFRPDQKRQLVASVQIEWGISERRACATLLVLRSTCQYRPRRPESRIKEISETRVRHGYRRAHVRLQREGWEINHKKVHRVYSELGP